jgi:hypothetical protein
MVCHTRALLQVTVAFMGLALIGPQAGAAPPPPPWKTQNIGPQSAPGSTDVDAAGVWSMQGSAYGVNGRIDQLHVVTQPLKGDGSITARFLSLKTTGGTAAGLIVREDDTPTSPTLSYVMTAGGLSGLVRSEAGGVARSLGPVGANGRKEANLALRLQRVGQEIAGFYSRDGSLWFQSAIASVTLPALKEEALVGLTLASGRSNFTATAQFDQVSVQPGLTSVYGLQACGADKAVLLQWRPLKNAVGYNVYRGTAGATSAQLTRLNTDQVAGASFTDNSADLVNDTVLTYAVAPILTGADGSPTEGPRVGVLARPVGLPQGLFGCQIGGGESTVTTAVDAATGAMVIKASGGLFFGADQFYFVGQAVEGDAQITVNIPTSVIPGGGAGVSSVMIRESLDPDARNVFVGAAGDVAAVTWRRQTTPGTMAWQFEVDKPVFKLPTTLRLTRRGNTITPEYSADGGQTFQPVGDPTSLDPPLPRTLYFGLFTSGKGTYSNLVIQKL